MSDIPAGLETLDFFFAGGRPAGAFAPVLVGVVGSGNLEVLLEPAARDGCAVRVETSARGFGPIWQAVMKDFHARHPLAGVRVSINDMGATPAVVSLRLDQAVADVRTGAQA
ncbi:malonate decarboxylase acyl carrier protein [Variovorax defluvii]|uniref:Malonate decarboxylase acyl carrier protein n=1 Tax=Variovorax defluvii TaxID=913761 RepID=A0ABP8I1L5_9BURK